MPDQQRADSLSLVRRQYGYRAEGQNLFCLAIVTKELGLCIDDASNDSSAVLRYNIQPGKKAVRIAQDMQQIMLGAARSVTIPASIVLRLYNLTAVRNAAGCFFCSKEIPPAKFFPILS